MACPSGPGSSSLNLLQQLLGKDGSRSPEQWWGQGAAQPQRNPPSSRLWVEKAAETTKCFPKSCRISLGLVYPGVQQREKRIHPAHPQGSRGCISIPSRMEFGIFFFFFTAVFSPPLSLSPSGLFLSFAGAQEFS